MQDLILLILGNNLYNIILADYPLFLSVISLLFTLMIILMFFKLMGALFHLN